MLAAAGFAAGLLLILSEFFAIRYVTTGVASCQELAQGSLRDSCLVIGHESHAWALAVLGLFVVVMTFGAAVGGSRPAAIALLVAGVVGLGITLFHDLPKTGRNGGVGQDYAHAKSHKGTAFWFELVGSSLALACGGFATWRTPPRYERRPRAATEPSADAPPDAEEPASA